MKILPLLMMNTYKAPKEEMALWHAGGGGRGSSTLSVLTSYSSYGDEINSQDKKRHLRMWWQCVKVNRGGRSQETPLSLSTNTFPGNQGFGWQ